MFFFFPLAFRILLCYIFLHGGAAHLSRQEDHARGCGLYPRTHRSKPRGFALELISETLSGLELAAGQWGSS